MNEGICSVIYAAPRTEIKGQLHARWSAPSVLTPQQYLPELHVLREMLMHKYGREFAVGVMENRDGCVNERVSSGPIGARAFAAEHLPLYPGRQETRSVHTRPRASRRVSRGNCQGVWREVDPAGDRRQRRYRWRRWCQGQSQYSLTRSAQIVNHEPAADHANTPHLCRSRPARRQQRCRRP